MIFRPTVWQHRCLWIWNAGNDAKTTRQWIAGNARRLGFDAVCVKVHDGVSVFHGPQGENAEPAYFRTLRAAGLLVGGWGYLEGDGLDGNQVRGAETEALLAAERCHTLPLDFYVADPEDRYSYSPVDNPVAGSGRKRFGYSIRFVRAFAKAIGKPGFPRGVASYGRVDFHDLDWRAWALKGPDGTLWRCIPQTYANESQALAPDLCTTAALRYWDRRYIHPLIGVYQGALGRHSPAGYAAELRRARTRGFGVYSLDAVDPTELPAYGKIDLR